MTPSVATFIVYVANTNDIDLRCPSCSDIVTPPNNGATIRDLIDAASTHAREYHPVSYVTATKAV